MRKRFLGSSGLQVSVLAFGTMNFGQSGRWAGVGGTDLAEAQRQIDRCFEAGITLFDSADAYSNGESEEILGQALGKRRKDVVVATKAFGRMGPGDHDSGLSRRHLVEACEASLKRLGTDWIDLYQMHGWDGVVPVEETLRALEDLIRDGKIRYIGCSNFGGWQLMKSLATADRLNQNRYVAQQIQYSLAVRDAEHELIPAAIDQGVGSLIWSPLGQGYLTGKFRSGDKADSRLGKSGNIAKIDNERTRATVDVLCEIAAHYEGGNPAQIAIAWLLRRPGVTSVILGARNDLQLSDTINAAAIRLDDETMDRLNVVSSIPAPYPLSHQLTSGRDRSILLPGSIDYLPD